MARGVELISQMALIENSIPWPFSIIFTNLVFSCNCSTNLFSALSAFLPWEKVISVIYLAKLEIIITKYNIQKTAQVILSNVLTDPNSILINF